MKAYRSGFSPDIEKFVRYRKASGSWNEYASGQNLMLFDHFCAEHYGEDVVLSQEMVDRWCMRRITETSSSCYTRTLAVREFIDYLRERGMTNVLNPKTPKLIKRKYIPHAFTEEELSRIKEDALLYSESFNAQCFFGFYIAAGYGQPKQEPSNGETWIWYMEC